MVPANDKRPRSSTHAESGGIPTTIEPPRASQPAAAEQQASLLPWRAPCEGKIGTNPRAAHVSVAPKADPHDALSLPSSVRSRPAPAAQTKPVGRATTTFNNGQRAPPESPSQHLQPPDLSR